MPLLIGAGETKTIQLQAEGYHKRPRHYAGGKFIDCTGAGCALCAAGVRVSDSYAMPISIGGVADEWIFPLGVSQQLDALTQQGNRLLGLVVKVSRTGSGVNTRYQVALLAQPQPVVSPTPAPPTGAVAPAIAPASATGLWYDGQSLTTADRWAALAYRVLARKDFLSILASEVQAMKDEGLWK